jgi:nickel-type superoxide dismutase maturation protease
MLRRLRSLLPLARYEVAGESMTPGLAAGERVLVNRAAYWLRAPQPGDVVVVRDPRAPQRLLIKRIDSVAGDDAWSIRGDNAPASTDSRSFGPVPRELLVGKVVSHY